MRPGSCQRLHWKDGECILVLHKPLCLISWLEGIAAASDAYDKKLRGIVPSEAQRIEKDNVHLGEFPAVQSENKKNSGNCKNKRQQVCPSRLFLFLEQWEVLHKKFGTKSPLVLVKII